MSKEWNVIESDLSAKLHPSNVFERQGYSYIKGWHAIAEANRIFGFENWNRETIYCKEISREKNANGLHVVGYEAKVRVVVLGNVVREGTGHGSGIARGLFDAIEGAAKEAETDAMKRALMTFGNPFGLALYDTSQANVGKPEPTPEEKLKMATQFTDAHIASLEACETVDQYDAIGKRDAEGADRIEGAYPDLHDRILRTREKMDKLLIGTTKDERGEEND